MADLNALIAQGAEFKVPDLLGSYAKFAKVQDIQRENALAQMKMDEYNRSLDEQNRLRAYLQGSDVTTPEGRKGLIQFGKTGLELGKTLLEQEKEAALGKKAGVETSAAESNLIDSKLKQSRAFLDTIDPNDPNAANQYIAWHEANHRDPVLGPVLAARGITAESARANIMQKLNQPGGVATLIEQSRLGSEKFQERIRPKPKQVARADGSIIFMDENPDSPTFGKEIMPSQAAGMTPYQIEQNKIAKGQLAVSQGHLKVAQDRLKEEGIKLSAEDDNLLATAIAEGRVDVNKVNGRNAKYLVGALKAQPGIDLREMSIENIASGAGARALGTQSAKMQTAAIEADKMIDIVRTTSAAIDRTQFPTINAIQNAVDKGTGGREIVQLNTAINSLVNSYARAISPTGQPTVSDKNHAREVINSAYSNGQIDAITDIMRQEMAIAKASPKEAQEAAREMRKGETKTPSVSPQDKQALDWANANPGDPRAAKIKATLGVK